MWEESRSNLISVHLLSHPLPVLHMPVVRGVFAQERSVWFVSGCVDALKSCLSLRGMKSEPFREDCPEGGPEPLSWPSLSGLPWLSGFIIFYSSRLLPHPLPACPVTSLPCCHSTSSRWHRPCARLVCRPGRVFCSRTHSSWSTRRFRCPQLLLEASPDAYNSQSALQMPLITSVTPLWSRCTPCCGRNTP